MTGLAEATAAAVRLHLKARGIRQVDAAPVLELSQQALSDRLTGVTAFTLRDLERLAEHYGIEVREPIVSPPLLANAQAERERREQVSA
jgi:predicted XRE-type DNA-binding protein